MAAASLGSDGIPLSLENQENSSFTFDATETPKSLTLHPAIAPKSTENETKVPLTLPSLTHEPWLSIFSQNVAIPAMSVTLPPPGEHSEDVDQVTYWHNMLHQCSYPSSAATNTPGEPFDPAQNHLTEPHAQSDDNTSRIRSLIQRVVEEFFTSNLKTTDILSEVISLASSLDQSHYRKVLNCVIAEFETARLLDLALLQGLVQLVESASPDYLEPGDLARILDVLRTRLQDTHQQSTKHSYYLTWGLSRLLDVMVEGKVKDLRGIVEQEPLTALFNLLKDSNDPYLKFQVAYALQSVLHVPNDEDRRRRMLRYSGDITMGLLGVASVCKLDLEQLKGGTDHLYEGVGDTCDADTKNGDGARSLFENDRGIWDSVKGGNFLGRRQLWYTGLREAQQHIRNGRLQDFKNLAFKAPCRDHIGFQWGICQLLGGIAIDPMWAISLRQQAIDFLVELYKNDSIWTTREGVYRCIQGIFRMIVALKHNAILNHTLVALQNLEKAGDSAKQELYREALAGPLFLYPIQVRLPIPTSSTLLSRVLTTPTVKYSLRRLKDHRLENHGDALYIQLYAKSSLQASDETSFPLMEKVRNFLAGSGQVFLLHGDSGSGKSTSIRQLEHTLWKSYENEDPIPLHINLAPINSPLQDIIAKRLRQLGFNDTQITELKKKRQFIVICDGYDESQLTSNIYTSNRFNHPGHWKAKLIVSCRTQYLSYGYRNWFTPEENSTHSHSTSDLFQEAVIVQFKEEQIKTYIDTYVKLQPHTWSAEDYMNELDTIPSLMNVVGNPFLLSLVMKVLPKFTEGVVRDLTTTKIVRAQLYDILLQHWLEVNQRRLISSSLKHVEGEALSDLIEDDFVSQGIDYLQRLAAGIFKEQGGYQILQYTHQLDRNSWKEEFFGTDPKVKLLRDASPLKRVGNRYCFLHRSFLEYLISCVIYNTTKSDEEFGQQDQRNPLFQRDLLQEPSVIRFLCDRVELDHGFKHQLQAIIHLSKTDASACIAASNAITILVRASVPFNGADLRGVKIPGADLSNGQFESAQFQGADLTGVNLTKCWLRQADMSGARMEAVQFGELPYIEMYNAVYSCAYSPDGRMLGVSLSTGIIHIFDTSTWTVRRRLSGHTKAVRSIAFLPDSQRLVSGSDDKTVRLWDTTSGLAVLVMEGHSDGVHSVAISPTGKRIASASSDKTVQVWDAQTGKRLFVLNGHTSSVMSVKYSPGKRQLVSGSLDGTIRFWDPKTGEPGIVLSPSSGEVRSLALSPDGQRLVAGYSGGQLQFWDVATLKPSPIFRGHTDDVTGIDFSPDGRWLASSSRDQTVRLWDTSTSALLGVLTGSNSHLNSLAFSPYGLMITSGGLEFKVRLWDVNSHLSTLTLRDDGRVEGSNLGTLCTEGAIFTNVVGLGPMDWKLLVQRGVICSVEEPIF